MVRSKEERHLLEVEREVFKYSQAGKELPEELRLKLRAAYEAVGGSYKLRCV